MEKFINILFLQMNMTKNSKSTDSARNELVVYSSHSLDLAEHIRKLQTPIKNLNPETRIVSDESMYAGGFYGIEFDRYGINGTAYIRFLESLKEGNPIDASLLEKMNKKLFGEQKIDDWFLVEHEKKKYRQQWITQTGETELFHWNNAVKRIEPIDFPMQLKTQIAKERDMLVSNEMMLRLFAPLFDPVIQTYLQVRSY